VISRREFFHRAAAAGAAVVLRRSLGFAQPPPGEELPPQREALNEAEWRTLEAIAGRILPTDERPGAIEAGCAWFVDRALAHEEADQRPLYTSGLIGIEKLARIRHGRGFAELGDADRDELLGRVEAGEVEEWPDAAGSAVFFAAVRRHVILGFLSDPSYGGNKNFAGWRAAGHPGPRHHQGAKLAAAATPQQLVGGQPIVPIWEETGIRTRFL
jgi:gluconate 2-dehydrogenase gamma chain